MSNTSHPDQRYIEGLIKNDVKVIEEIYRNFSMPIVKYVCQNNGTKEDANDVIQEALTVIYIKGKETDIQLSSKFLTYFFTICRNIWLKFSRKKSNHSVTLNTNLVLIDDDNIEKTIVKRERYQFYLLKMQEISAECQQLLLHYINGKKMKEIAKLMGYKTENYARKRKMICKGKLMNRIEQDHRYKELTEKI